MTIIKCKMCGGDIELTADKTFGTCEYCGSTMTFPKVDDEQRTAAFNRGNHFRRIGEFDKALSVYERIVREDNADAEAHWCCALCRFGIEYVEDPATLEYLPTCHRASFDSFLEDVDYLAALEYSDGITRRQYQKDAAKIAEVQRGILATSQNEAPFDVFICYKESDDNGQRTRDSLIAQDVYYQLTDKGYRVFFARITLEDIAGKQYEPYIFAALNSAKVMVVIGTKPEHMNAIWVKNEWSRFLAMMKKDHSKILLPCYRDMDPYDMPEQLSVLQSYDMSKIGFIQDLIRGIEKLTSASKPKHIEEQPQQSGVNTAPLLRRVYLFLEDGDWASADEYCEKVLDLDPENGEAYLGKMMAELKIRRRENLSEQADPFDNNPHYQKALRFGDEKLQDELKACITTIKQQNERARLLGLYKKAEVLLAIAKTKEDYTRAAEIFSSISHFEDAQARAEECKQKAHEIYFGGLYATAVALMKSAKSDEDFIKAEKAFDEIKAYRDSEKLSAECAERAEYIRKNAIYTTAVALMTGNRVQNYKRAISQFEKIRGFKDSEEKIELCDKKIEQINAAILAAGIKRKGRAQLRLETLKENLPLIKKVAYVVVPVLIVAILAAIVLPTIDFSKKERPDISISDIPANSEATENTSSTSTLETETTETQTPSTQTPSTQTPTPQQPSTQIPTPQQPPAQPPTQPQAGSIYHQEGCPFANGAKEDSFALRKGNLLQCSYASYADGTTGFWHIHGNETNCFHFTYDREGKLVEYGEWEKDSNGNVTKDIQYDINGNATFQQENKFDSAGNSIGRIEIYYDSAGNITSRSEFKFKYDSASYYREEEIRIFYDSVGNITSHDEYKYDSAGNRIEQISIYYDGAGNIIGRIKHKYDSAGNVTERIKYDANGNVID